MSEKKDETNLVGLYKKIFAVKAELGAVTKDSNNPFFKSKYADLNAHLETVEPILAKNNLVLTQTTTSNGQANFVRTEITDITTGAQIMSVLLLPNLDDMQKLGGAITYARRYTLGAALAIQTEDDDGQTAVGKGGFVKAAPPRAAKSSNVVNKDF